MSTVDPITALVDDRFSIVDHEIALKAELDRVRRERIESDDRIVAMVAEELACEGIGILSTGSGNLSLEMHRTHGGWEEIGNACLDLLRNGTIRYTVHLADRTNSVDMVTNDIQLVRITLRSFA